MLNQALDALIASLSDPDSEQEDIHASASDVFRAVGDSVPADVAAAMRRLAEETFGLEDGRRAGFAATVCGALIENGYDPAPVAGPLSARLDRLVPRAAALALACEREVPEIADDDDDEATDREVLLEQVREWLALKMPEEAKAWNDLESFWPPTIAFFSVSPEARARASHLIEPALALRNAHEAGHWLHLLLSVPHDDPILVIEPTTGLGIEGRMSGVAENFQLHVILMHLFPKADPSEQARVSPSAAEIALGEGEQSSTEVISGHWNLYTWQAVRPDLALPDAKDFTAKHTWIWGEGKPADVPVLEGRRVILLGPPAYPRTWGSQRAFNRLPVTFVVSAVLKPPEVRQWLSRMAEAAAVSDQS